MNHFNNALSVFSAAFYACFGNSNLSWPLKPQDPLGNCGQDSELQLQQARLFLPMHPSACQGLPVSRAAVLGSTPCCFPDWKKKKKKVINNSSCVLVLSISPNSWQPLTQLLKRTNGLAMESWDFDSRPQFQLQVPPWCLERSQPLLLPVLLSCPLTASEGTDIPLLLGLPRL